MVKLQKLDLWNFKSFKKAKIPFSKGFTTIAGPNGTGKSNILDALLFALGITSLKMLRATKLTDLVHHDAEGDIARVDLYLKGKEGEYKVSRTIDRQGKSVYRLDDKRCSLNEVASMLGELSINPSGYNIVVQGDITRIIQMNPRERRQIIDEVAGIKEFEEKREEALKELGKVENRIKEARIVLNEREQFLKDLEGERESAKKFEALSKELKETKATVLRLEIGELRKQNTVIEEKEKAVAGSIAEKAGKRQEIGEKIAGLEQEMEETTNALIKANEEIFSEIGKEIEEHKAEKRICEEKKNSLGEELEREMEKIRVLVDKNSALAEEKSSAEKEKLGAGQEIERIGGMVKAFEEEKVSEKFFEAVKKQSAKEAELGALKDALKQLKKAQSKCPTCDSRLGEKKRRGIVEEKQALEEKCKQQLISLEHEIRELEQKRQQEKELLDALREHRQKMFQAKTSLEGLEKIAKEGFGQKSLAEKRVAEIEESLKGLEKKAIGIEKQLGGLEVKNVKASEKNRQRSEQKEALKQKLSGLVEKKNAVDADIRKKEQGLNELNLEKSKNEVRLDDLTEEEKEFQGIKSIEGAVSGKLGERVPKIEREISSLGAINMKALESFGELDREVQDLRGKANKLEEERISVLNLIQSIEDRRLEAFMACFGSVSKNFNKIFYSFFEGQGALSLSDEKNPLESGLMIEAKHKSEKMKTIDLMSGGEKSLTALAFLFAIQLHEPSPFYVFDEADAALDKENSIKVAKMVRDIAQNNQFIAITHNDVMIKESDQVVGVALNKNKSSVIGLKLKEKLVEAV